MFTFLFQFNMITQPFRGINFPRRYIKTTLSEASTVRTMRDKITIIIYIERTQNTESTFGIGK